MRVGIGWYKREEYDRIKTVMEDGNKLPATYDQFLTAFEQGIQVLRRGGHIPVKVYIDPDAFPLWCRERGMNVDARARLAFGNDFVLMSMNDN